MLEAVEQDRPLQVPEEEETTQSVAVRLPGDAEETPVVATETLFDAAVEEDHEFHDASQQISSKNEGNPDLHDNHIEDHLLLHDDDGSLKCVVFFFAFCILFNVHVG